MRDRLEVSDREGKSPCLCKYKGIVFVLGPKWGTNGESAGAARWPRPRDGLSRGPASVVAARVLDDLAVVGQYHTFLLFLSGIIVPVI